MTASDPPQLSPPHRRLSPAGVALIYVLFSALWIVSSDVFVTFSVADPALQHHIELVKGLPFVVLPLLGLAIFKLHGSKTEREALAACNITRLALV